MFANPLPKSAFGLLPSILALCFFVLDGYGQCGVYLRPASTQFFPYPKVYLDRAADMTGDGIPDLLATQSLDNRFVSRNRLFVIPNNGNGTFGSPTIIDPPAGDTFSYQYFVGKVNGDTSNDIIAYKDYGSGSSPETMLVYLNNGNGTFGAPVVSSASQRGLVSDLVDVNGDGIRDYVGFWGSDFKYGPGVGDGTFGAPVTIASSDGSGLSADFNNDGKADFVNTRHLYMNNGDGTFTVTDLTSMLGISALIFTVKDFNGDSRSDILASTPSGLTLLKRTDTSFEPISIPTPNIPGESSFQVGKFNSDAFTDFVISYRSVNTKIVYTSDAAGNFTTHQYSDRFYYFNFLNQVFADFDNDGDDDAVQLTSLNANGTVMLPFVTSFTFKKNVCDRVGQPRIIEFDGTGNTDYSFWNPATGDWSWHANPYDGETNQTETVNWGLGSLGDIPTPGDFDGDGVTDRAVYRNSTGVWYIRRSSDQAWYVLPFGLPGDKPVVADYDGDTISDVAVWRPSDGNWYFWYMGTQQFAVVHFGLDGDKPAQADFDGDFKTDVAVYRPSTGVWYYLKSSNGAFVATQWGLSADKPIPGDYDGDGKADIAVFRESDRFAYIVRSYDSAPVYYQVGLSGDYITVGDWDGDFVADLGYYRPSNRQWYSSTRRGIVFGVTGGIPTSSIVRYE